ncbi:MarR family transcriptional regulator BagL/FevM [Streptomyces sp. AP-93]|uniref:MarR family transcriptional regulator BagL/FevM n=1 Tax=Streptomyces sp. AP-93 TaxID=2929048 RepID=UPI001FAFD58D|nr:MarR family transcriptional regulator BagL/FevM [Streptomyces sp. AP-93]MCJ0874029.1 MarR family winged helix-turn-helix transcriptional regulator [Streptomyces sp. AP-93]
MTNTSPPPRPQLEEALPHQLRRAGQAWTALWQQRLPDLTSPQFAVLLTLDDHGSMDQSALGALAAVDRSTLTVLLDRLNARGLVTKEMDPANRKRRIVALTDTGHRHLTEAVKEAGQLHAQVEELLGERRLRQLVDMLRVLGDMQAQPSPGGSGPGRPESGSPNR